MSDPVGNPDCWFSRAMAHIVSESLLIEPSREKTNNVVSEQVRHKPGCTSTEDG